jgi:Transposase
MLLRLAVVSTQEERHMVYLGIDWAEAHHDVCLLDESGARLGKARVPDGIEGLARIHELVGTHTSNPETVVVGIETDRGLLVQGWWPPATRCMPSTRSR